MHDPMTVAFEIRRPWPVHSKTPGGKDWKYYPPMLIIWHVDPEKDGTDNSCDWHCHKLSAAERAAALDMLDNKIDNLSGFLGDMDRHDQEHILLWTWRRARRFYKPRPWWQHPKWHIWHWEIQVPLIQRVQRYLFSRCCKCGGRFPWGYSPMSGWSGDGPRWFRGEPGVWHHDCDTPMSSGAVRAVASENHP